LRKRVDKLFNITGLSKQSFIGKILRKSLKLVIPKDAVLPILQGPARGMKWLVGSSVNACWLGSYEFRKQQKILEYLQPGMVAYDIGAHAGFFTLIFSRIVGPSGKVYAFEPLPENIRFLRKHQELNKSNNVIIEPVAVSNKNEEICFYKDSQTYKGNIVNNNSDIIDNIKVESITIDHYIEINNKRSPDFIKMDVEGAESMVLTGMAKLMAIKKPILFIALHNEEVAKECSLILKKYNYEIFDLEGNATDISRTFIDEIIAP
jgi:FkbM family methyltransferase